MEELGRLVRVSPRLYWPSGAADFTRWLVKDDNIRLLDDALGLNIKVEAQTDSRSARAGILCRDLATGHPVLIESQVESTDQAHLGRLLTRAAGLREVTCIWIAEHFSEEHRATLEWLNDATNETIHFFGVEIELWQIGNSPLAPRFTVVSRPGGSAKTVPNATHEMQHDAPAVSDESYQDYWAALKDVLDQRNSAVRLATPAQHPWCSFVSGNPGLNLVASVYTRERRIMAGVLLHGPDAKRLFHLLHSDKEAIEVAIGVALEWRELPGKQQSQVLFFKSTDPADRRLWGMQHTWLAYALEALRSVFGPRIEPLMNAASQSGSRPKMNGQSPAG